MQIFTVPEATSGCFVAGISTEARVCSLMRCSSGRVKAVGCESIAAGDDCCCCFCF